MPDQEAPESPKAAPKYYGLGYKPDTHDKSKDPTVRGLLGAAINIPPSASFEEYVHIWDQGQTSSCTGWAFAQVIQERCAILKKSIPLPSPTGLYTNGRALARAQAGLKPEDAPLTDEGAQPSLIVQGMAQWGVASINGWPFDPATIDDEPDLEDLEVASAFLVHSVNRVNSEGQGRLQDIRHAIANGYPVAIGTSVDQAFMNYKGGKNKNGTPIAVTKPDPSAIIGGHMMHLCGYTAAGLFRGVNQWGATEWGDGGFYWADESFITTDLMTDIYVISCSASGR